MRQGFWDHHSHEHSLVHDLSAQGKLLLFIFVAVETLILPAPGFKHLAAPGLFVLLLIFLTRISFTHTLLKYFKIIWVVIVLTILLPFFGKTEFWHINGIIIYSDGLQQMAKILCRSSIIILMMIVINLTTPFEQTLLALQKWKVPRLFIALLSFTYRFIFNTQDELARIRRSWHSRAFHVRPWRQWHFGAQLIGTLFIRTLERGERTYHSMNARGFRGIIHSRNTAPISGKDLVFILLSGLWFIAGHFVF